MNVLELLQNIGNEVCEDCPGDCGIDPKECDRILHAHFIFKKYIKHLYRDINDMIKIT